MSWDRLADTVCEALRAQRDRWQKRMEYYSARANTKKGRYNTEKYREAFGMRDKYQRALDQYPSEHRSGEWGYRVRLEGRERW